MGREDAERILLDAGGKTDGDFPLLDAAIACAIHEDPSRDPQAARDLGAASVERLGQRLKQESAEEALAETMAGDMRLSGDLFTYEDPENADIIAVCERRKGLAVALGVFYLHASRTCGLTVQGVDFPGHFLLRIETDEGPLALDPFSEGRVVLPSELTRRALHAGLTPNVADRLDRLMAPVTDRAVLLRLQNTIFARASQARDFARAERAAIRRALLDPTDHRPWLDVAAAREGQGALAGSLEALARATELDGGAALAARAQRERVRLQLELVAVETPIVVVESRLKAGLAAIGSVIFVATGFWMLTDPKASHDAAMLCIAFFSFCGLAGAVQFVLPNRLILDPSGFTVRTAWNRRHVAWSQASNFRLYEQRRTRVVAYDVAADAPGGVFQSASRCLPAFWSKSPPEVLALLEAGKAKWG